MDLDQLERLERPVQNIGIFRESNEPTFHFLPSIYGHVTSRENHLLNFT